MPTAKKLPSGSWHCTVFSHMDGQKRVYRSFTVSDPSPKGKRKCEQIASEWAAQKEQRPRNMRTVGECMDEYISIRENVISPTTIKQYKIIRKNDFSSIMDKPIEHVTQTDIQREVNIIAGKNSPKTVRNKYGLITAVMDTYRPDLRIKCKLPQKEKNDKRIPSEDEIKRLLEVTANTPMEIPLLLAIFATMRRGEICALRTEDIDGDIIHVHRSLALDENNEWVEKPPKTLAGDRRIMLPHWLIDKLLEHDGRIVELTPTAVTKRFVKLLKAEGIEPFSFHALRHFSSSMLHAAGIPDKYIMERAGWDSDYALKNIYRHTIEEEKRKNNEKMNTTFASLL